MRLSISTKEHSHCTGCGTCAGICPRNNIEMQRGQEGTYFPIFKDFNCQACSLCVEACPGRSTDLASAKHLSLGEVSYDQMIGHFMNCYVGHSADKVLRLRSSSGGLASEIAAFAIEAKWVDGVVVTKMKEGNPLEPKVFVARTREEVISASGSKYCPVPVNISIKCLLNHHEKFAVVGLPCHIHGLRKAEFLNSNLRSKISLHIGLFCNHTVNFWGTEFLLGKIGLERTKVARLSYRESGWPGDFTVTLHGGDKMRIPMDVYWRLFFSQNFFTPLRCTFCSDMTNEKADLSLGDAWLPELVKESIIVTRTQKGEQILREATERGRIHIRKISSGDVVRSAKGGLYSKKKGLEARINLMKALGQWVPHIDGLPRPNLVSYIIAALTYSNIYASKRRSFRKLLRYIPHPVLDAYGRMISTLIIWGQ